MELCLRSASEAGLSEAEMLLSLRGLLEKHPARKVLIIPPDYTRYHSNAGFLANVCYHFYENRGAWVDVMPALGTHVPVTRAQAADMFGDIPFERFLAHNWRSDVLRLGEVPGAYLSEATGGLWTDPIDVEVNRRVMDPAYDLILSLGQVVPHEVVGMANHAKNLFVGVGGADMINKSHMLGAVYGMERMMGRDHSPVRQAFDYAFERYLARRPILFLMTVTTAPGGHIATHGLFAGAQRDAFEAAVALAQQKNINYVDRGIQKCVAYLDPKEFQSTWIGNKAVYRTRMAIRDGGELVVLAPGVERFGEDGAVDALIRKYGYQGRERVLSLFQKPENRDLWENMGAAAHLIHSSSDGRFTITYAVKNISKREIGSVHYAAADYLNTAARYDPERLSPGFNTLPDGEEVFFIPNPALGLWVDRERFER